MMRVAIPLGNEDTVVVKSITKTLAATSNLLARMADPLSIAASVTGILAFTAATARGLATLVLEIRDAPEDISVLGRDVQSLAAVLVSVHDVCIRYGFAAGGEDGALAAALADYLEVCQEAMQGLRVLLKPFATESNGSGRRSPVRFVIGWTMKKGEVRALRTRLNEGKASLTLTLSALNGLLEGKGQEHIRAEINKVYEQINCEFRNLDVGTKVRNRVEDDAISILSTSRDRPFSTTSGIMDGDFAMHSVIEQPTIPTPTTSAIAPVPPVFNSSVFLTPWADDPNAIFEAVRSQNAAAVKALISRGIPLSSRSTQGYTPLHHCAIANNEEIATLLINRGADINAKSYEFHSPLHVALVSESLMVARLLVKRGCVIGDMTDTLVRLASRSDLPGLEPMIQAFQGRLEEAPSRGPFLVHAAISRNATASLKGLLTAGFSATIPNEKKISPLYHALIEDRRPMLKCLVEHGADPNEYISGPMIEEHGGLPSSWYSPNCDRTNPEITPLLMAARSMRSEAMVRTLLELGADPNKPTGGNRDPGFALWGLCAHDYLAQAQAMIQGGANVNAPGNDSRGPVYWAAMCKNVTLMKILITHGADVNHQWSHDANTALIIAARKGQAEMVRLLLGAGADRAIKTYDGQTALDVAKEKNHRSVVALLEEADT